MRLRYNKNSKAILESNKYFISYQCNKINLTNLFKNNYPCYLEIGAGKGNFIIENALRYPNINFIAIEKNATILAKAIKKIPFEKINNLFFIQCDANKINDIFFENSFSKIFLNFSDPWPKKRHAKRRLTNPFFLDKYQIILKDDGLVEFKTDNKSLFEYTYNDVLKNNINKYNIIYKSEDIYKNLNNEFNIENIPTEYEIKFHSLGYPIYKLIFNFKKYEH